MPGPDSISVQKPLVAPVLPERRDTINYTVTSGDSYGYLAGKYNTPVAIIKQANNTVGDELKIGQKIKIPTYNPKEWADYQKQDSIYRDAIIKAEEEAYAKKQAANKQANIEATDRVIEEYEQSGHDEYTLLKEKDEKGQSTGNVIIILNEGVRVSTIKEDFKLEDGVLIEYNPKEFDAPEDKDYLPGSSVKSHDVVTKPEGTEFVLPSTMVHPQKTFWQKTIDCISGACQALGEWWDKL